MLNIQNSEYIQLNQFIKNSYNLLFTMQLKEVEMREIIKNINSYYVEYPFEKLPLELYKLHLDLLEELNDLEGVYKLTVFLLPIYNSNNLITSYKKNLNVTDVLIKLFINIAYLSSLFLLEKDKEFLRDSNNYNDNLINLAGIIKKEENNVKEFINGFTSMFQIINKAFLIKRSHISKKEQEEDFDILLRDIIIHHYPKFLKDTINPKFLYLLFQYLLKYRYENVAHLLYTLGKIKKEYNIIDNLEDFILGRAINKDYIKVEK